MDCEYSALMNNKTWHLVPPTHNKNIIDCKWVYKIKRKPDGSINRYKAHLVAKVSSKGMALIMKTLLVLSLKRLRSG